MSSYSKWKQRVDYICYERLAISFDDLPDIMNYRNSFDAGTSPEEFFEELVEELQQDGWPVEHLIEECNS